MNSIFYSLFVNYRSLNIDHLHLRTRMDYCIIIPIITPAISRYMTDLSAFETLNPITAISATTIAITVTLCFIIPLLLMNTMKLIFIRIVMLSFFFLVSTLICLMLKLSTFEALQHTH